ncbi:MAG: SDR family oxidoreductase [Lewinella sp.]|nr:SDR family oxidoreductase [Lewinella sp.]
MTYSIKYALVTGGSRGIGAATAKALAAQGATVAISYNSSPEQAEAVVAIIQAAGGKLQPFQSQTAPDPVAVHLLVEGVVEKFGKLDILVNNAGVFVGGPLNESALDAYEQNFNVNVRGVYETTRAAISRFNDGGRIINIGSFLSTSAFPGVSAYGATKAAVAGLTRSWAKEFAGRKITVNTLHPGSIDTEMNPDNESNPTAGFQKSLNPLGRYGTAEEIAAAVVFLAADEASFVTGADLYVDGGASA